MAVNLKVSGVDLATYFKVRTSTKRADVGFKYAGSDISNAFEPATIPASYAGNPTGRYLSTAGDIATLFMNNSYQPLFLYTDAVFVGWIQSPGLTNVRYSNIYTAGFVLDSAVPATSIAVTLIDDAGTPFAHNVTWSLTKNGSTIRSGTAVTSAAFTLTGAGDIENNVPYNLAVAFSASPNIAIKARVTTALTGAGQFIDASLKCASQVVGAGIGGAAIYLAGVPVGSTIAYVSVADFTLGGYMTSVAGFYPMSWNCAGATSGANAYYTNIAAASATPEISWEQTHEGGTLAEIGCSRLAPPNPAVPTYTLSLGVIGDGFTMPYGSNTYTAGTSQPILASEGGMFFSNWISSGAGVNNLSGIADVNSASTNVFVDGNKTLTAFFTP